MKNRGYAASCRIKRLEQKGDLEMEKGKEFQDLDLVQVRKVIGVASTNLGSLVKSGCKLVTIDRFKVASYKACSTWLLVKLHYWTYFINF